MKTNDKFHDNVVVLGSAAQLAVNVIKEVAGNEIADTVEKQPLSTMLADTCVASINSQLTKKGAV
ncbi:MAG: hypothetical protein CMF37_14655 [Leeuwenhoekiella sp.]|jgi:hypothetical protein|nr:hypothetical protein [Leeuwenhoekiella sp.]MBQ50146.1 hypothetical protein [Leeuwenhoekiella sp.]MBQ50343.1 hypothetical protein [Leeuwenhoekiella sp.]MBQ50540.1 hypothetical protein [Leeuwenhoekiella sp.]|tara:strand:- start:1567 stop:1761 length:195 start_codon:yes stop_codon:yes gene_type:complete